MSNHSDIRLGVIGAGNRGFLAAHAHRPEEGVRVVAAMDIKDAVLQKCREKYGPDTFLTRDYHALLQRDDIDAVFITSPDFLHEEHTLAALGAGKHVYLEKPMAITVEGCDRILAAARDNQCKLFVGHNMRHFPVMRKMKQLIDQGAIGQVKSAWCRHFISYGGDAYFKDWHAERARSTGLLLQKGAHDIDILHWLCGSYTRRVTAMGGLTVYDQITDRHAPDDYGNATWSKENWPPLSQKQLNPVIDVEDLSMVLMELDGGIFASYQQCHYTPDAWRNYTVIGTEGRIENFGDVPGEAVVRVWNQRHGYHPAGDIKIDFPPLEGSHGGADPLIVAEFIRFLRTGGKTSTSPVGARNSVAAGCAATASLRAGSQPMDIAPPPADLLEYFGPGLDYVEYDT